MAYDEVLAERVRATFQARGVFFEEKKMMGGLCFMVDDKMCVGVHTELLMLRLDPAIESEALVQPACRPMDFTGRPMRGFVFVKEAGFSSATDLGRWVDLALDFNPRVKSSKKRKASTKSS